MTRPAAAPTPRAILARTARLAAPFAVLLAGGLALGACAGPGWTKAGADQAALQRDMGECAALAPPPRREPEPPAYPSNTPGADMGSAGLNNFGALQTSQALSRMDTDEEFMNRCMRGKGWTAI
ncbi:hypothetical protein [Zavarzinia sp. CC-PAN008]|uniref:hypothetical protein n=1 Tax=Zavarzinia sp. CC-PAN008 TaxID=3243332 RepID=UPI003F743240